MEAFVGRETLLHRLTGLLNEVAQTGRGCLLSVRGRRRVGKSRLLEEWLRRERVPHVFFAASRQPPERELALFAQEVASAATHGSLATLLPGGAGATGVRFDAWEPALSYLATLAAGRPTGTDTESLAKPLVIVLDEFPYLVDGSVSLEGTIQKVWDRVLQHIPLMLVLVGSDSSMMAALTEYGRPLYGRARELVIPPFSPLETATLQNLAGAAALDAYLVVGGFPLVVQTWRRGHQVWQFLARELADPTSPLIVTGERIVAAEFPAEAQARDVLGVIGAGETTFTAISNVSGVSSGALTRSLDILVRQKNVVAAIRPLASIPSRETRYLVADPYLRFWLRFIRPGIEEIERGRSDLVLERIRTSWETYRGRAIEPLIRQSIEQLLPDERFGVARYVGGFWTRTNDVQVDLVGAREQATPKRVAFVGSIKWRERAPFDRRDLAELYVHRQRVPGADSQTLLVAVSRAGGTADGVDVTLGPDELLAAWRTRNLPAGDE